MLVCPSGQKDGNILKDPQGRSWVDAHVELLRECPLFHGWSKVGAQEATAAARHKIRAAGDQRDHIAAVTVELDHPIGVAIFTKAADSRRCRIVA